MAKRRMASYWMVRTAVGAVASAAFAVVCAAQTDDDYRRALALTTCIEQALEAVPGVTLAESVI